MVALLRELRVERLHPRQDARVLVHADAHGQRVDEQAHRAVDARQLRRAARDGGAVDDVALTRVTRQRHRPGGLHHRVGRELVLAGEGLERRGQLGGQQRAQQLAGVRGAGLLGQQARQRRGGGEAAQRLAPERLRALHGLALDPGDVVAEGQRRALRRGAARAQVVVGAEQLLQDGAQAPPIQQQVVMRPEDPVRAVLQAHHRHARQRRLARVEAAAADLGHQRVEAGALLGLGHAAPVLLLPGDAAARVHDLHGLVQPAPEERGAQGRVALGHGVQRTPEDAEVHRAGERPCQVRDVDARRRLRERVEEHALLQWRQRVEVLHRQAGGQRAVQRGLVQLRQREVGRRIPARVRGRAGGDEFPQREEALRGQGLDGLLAVHGLAVRPAQREPPLEDVAVDLQQVAALALGAPQRAGGLARRGEGQRRALRAAHLVELAQVVEQHLRARRLLQRTRLRLAREVAQQPMADAAPGQPSQRVAHRAQPVSQRGGTGDIQHHRVRGGEPAHGARQVHVLEEGLTAVAFQLHAQPGLARPPRQAVGQCRQQHVVDVRAPGGRRLLQQQARLLRVQRHLHHARGGQRVRRARHVDGERGHLGAALLHPVGQLARQLLGAGEGVQLLRPRLEGGGLGRQRHRLAALELRVGRGQVLQQRAPGDAVHRQVMHRQEQSRRALRTRLEQAGAQKEPFLQVQASLEARGLGLHRLGLLGLGDGAQVHARQAHGCLGASELLLPRAVRPAREAQAQRVVVGHQRLEGLLQRGHVHLPARGEEDGLVVVVGQRGRLLEEGALDGRERHGAAHQALLGLDVALALRHACERLQRLVLEDVVGGQVQAGLTRAGDELDGEDGVTSQLEEVVVQPDAGYAEQLGPDGGQGLLLGGAWLLEGRGVALLGLRCGQGLAVHLAVGRQRQGLQDGEGGGHHVLGQPLGEEGAQHLDVRRGALVLFVGRHDVGDEPRAGGAVVAHHGHGVLDGRVGTQRGFDFAQLDAEAAQLHLEVGAAQVVQRAVRLPAHEVSRAVEALAGHATEGVGDEALGGQLRAAQVAARQAHAADEELSGHAGGHRVQVRVQHVETHVGQRAADGGLLAIGCADGEGGADGGLGGAVGVDEAAPRGPLRHQLRGAGLARGDDGAQAFEALGLHDGERGGRQRGHVDFTGAQHRRQRGTGHPLLARRQAQRAAGEEGDEDLGDGGVEAGGGELEDARARFNPHGARLGLRQVGHAPVSHRHALGAAGGAGGVDDVGEVVREHVRRGRRAGLPRELRRIRIQQHELLTARRQLVREVVQGDDDRDGGVGEHVAQPVGGVARVQGDEGAAGLEDTKHGDDEVDGALQVERDEGVGTDAQHAQVMRELVGAPVQLAKRERGVAVEERGGVRGAPGLGLEARVDGGTVGDGHGLTVPLHQHALALDVVHQRQLGQARFRVRGDGLQQRLEVRQQAAHRGLLEEVRAVHRDEAQALGQLGGQQRQVHLAGAAVHRLRFQHQPGHLQRRQGRVLQREADLEQRRGAQAALGLERLHQLLEGHVLVREGAERRLMHPRHQLQEGRVAGQVRAQGQRVDEQADEAFELGAVAARHRSADDDVVLTAVARQQHLVGGDQQGIEGAALAPGQLLERLEQRRGQHHREARTARAGDGRARPVGGQLQHGVGVELLAPVRKLRVQRLALEPVALPGGELGVLHAQRGQRRRLARGERGVERAQLPHQHTQGPAVGDDVVHVEQQQVLARAPAVEHRAQQRALLHVEGLLRLEVQVAPRLGLPLRRSAVRHVHHGQGDVDGGGDVLGHAPVLLHEGGAQGLVALHQLLERTAEGVDVELAGQAHGDGDVEGGAARVESLLKPHPLLREGHGRTTGLTALVAQQLREPRALLFWGQRHD